MYFANKIQNLGKIQSCLMKKASLTIALLFYVFVSYSQTPITDNEKLASLCKVWGFLKYYHPALAKGNIDWDRELMNRIDPVLAINGKEEISHYYADWINSLGQVKELRHEKHFTDSAKKNVDLKWMDNKTQFRDSLSSLLHYLERNKHGKKSYYVSRKFPQFTSSFSNEKTYPDSASPSHNLRMVALFRYWNIIQYYYPYKNIIDEDWNKVLDEMIPVFRQAKDTISYYYALSQLITRINDSHGSLKRSDKYDGFWKTKQTKAAPFKYKLIDNKAIVTGFYNDSFALIDDIQYGDVILTVGDKTVGEIIAAKSKYTSASNEPTKLDRLKNFAIFIGTTDTFKISYERNGVIATKTIHRYEYSRFNYDWKKKEEKVASKLIDSSIAYMDLEVLKPKDVKPTMEPLMNTKALIIDVRNYPNGTMYKISKILNRRKKRFVMFEEPYYRHPGVLKQMPPYTCGKRNRHYYKGKVILLFNETTQSHAEFTCMALQTAPDVTCIGSQTAGADGDVAKIPLPGGYSTNMTGLGVFYPDGRPTQRIGIVPDIKVTPTIEGIRQKKDEVLEKAIEFARSNTNRK